MTGRKYVINFPECRRGRRALTYTMMMMMMMSGHWAGRVSVTEDFFHVSYPVSYPVSPSPCHSARRQ